MAKARSRYMDYGVYLLVRFVGCVVQALPLSCSVWIVRQLAYAAYRFDRRHTQVAVENIQQAFPGVYTPAQLSEIARNVYEHFAVMLLEVVVLLRRIGSRRWRASLLENVPPHLDRALSSGRPLLIATAHFGNWELTAFMLRFYGIRAHLVARPMDNVFLDDMMRRFRESLGHKVLSKHGDLKRMREVLAAGGTLCTLGDQDAGERGLFVNFFGRPASTHRVIAHLARRTGALIVVVAAQNLGEPLKYRLIATDVIDPNTYANHADADYAITQRVAAGVELLVRHDPRQYFWFHRRWKSQPPQATLAAA
jgi:Kdo2-lipid IVA lauroyltransferase/acyltransferase